MEFINAKDLPLSGPMAESHGIIVLQDGKLRYMSLAEFQNYMASASIQTDPTLTVGGVAADAAVTGTAIKNARPVNFLDNSDFTNPVNQRGQGTYSDGGIYTIDRWKKRNTGVLTVVANEGVNITSTGTFGGLFQPIENGIKRLAGKTVTLAAYVLKNPGAFEMMLCNAVNNVTAGTTYGEQTFTNTGLCVSSATLPETLDAGEYLNFFIGEGDAGQEAGSELEIAWCALYEGEYTADNLPVYQPRGYGSELAECLRYYQNHKINTNLSLYSAGAYICSVGFFVPMRITPTIKIVISGEGIGIDYVTNTAAVFRTVQESYVTEFNASADL